MSHNYIVLHTWDKESKDYFYSFNNLTIKGDNCFRCNSQNILLHYIVLTEFSLSFKRKLMRTKNQLQTRGIFMIKKHKVRLLTLAIIESCGLRTNRNEEKTKKRLNKTLHSSWFPEINFFFKFSMKEIFFENELICVRHRSSFGINS